MSGPPPLRTRPICSLHVELGTVQEIGTLASGRRRVVPILGGRVEGPALQGEVLPGGADWQLVAPDGSAAIEARYTMRASDGGLILAHSRGMRNGPPAVLARLAAGEAVDPADYYFRVAVHLETSAPRLALLERSLFVASAIREANRVAYTAYRVT